MEYLEELKDLIGLHIRTQDPGGGRLTGVLSRIVQEDGGGAGGWVSEWVAEGRNLEQAGARLEAVQCYNFARFPFVDGRLRAEAHRLGLEAFGRWVVEAGRGISRLEAVWNGHLIPFWFSSAGEGRPLLIVLGGIVSPKEQWHQFLLAGRRLGCNVITAEFPGVGENTAPYGPGSHGFLAALIERVSGMADTDETLVVGMSFGGHLAMRLAAGDSRIRGITALGAPIHRFFRDRDWLARVPATTRKTLAHVMRVPADGLPEALAPLALDPAEVRRLDIPLHYVRSLRDEIVPPGEAAFLREHARNLEMVEFDDVHGSPNHMPEIRRYIPLSVLRQKRKPAAVPVIILKALLGIESMKRRRRMSAGKAGAIAGRTAA